MNIRPIKTQKDYRAALKETERLMVAEPESAEGDKLDVLATLIEAYEATHDPMDFPDAVEAIRFEMERSDLTVKDLEPLIGQRNRVSEILNYKRPLTLRMIRNLHESLGIPAQSLIKPYRTRAS